MSGSQARQEKIGRRYGYVLFDLARETNKIKAVSKDLSLLDIFLQKDQKSWGYLTSPIVPFRSQKKVIENIALFLKLGPLSHRFLAVVCQNRRLQTLAHAIKAYNTKVKAAEGGLEGVLESAIELSPKELRAVEKSLADRVGHPVSLHQDVKENLIAGIVVRVGSFMIDASLKSHLNKLQQAMKG